MKNNNANNDSLATQLLCVLNALQYVVEGLSIIALREKYVVMLPAACTYELRWGYGYNIVAFKEVDANAQGYQHRAARYIFFPGKWEGA